MTVESSNVNNNIVSIERTRFPETSDSTWLENLHQESKNTINTLDEKANQLIKEGKLPVFNYEEYRELLDASLVYERKNGELTRRRFNLVKILPRVWRNFPVPLAKNRGSIAENWLRDATPMKGEMSARNVLLHRNPDLPSSAQAFLQTLRATNIHYVVTLKNNWELHNGQNFWLYNVKPGESKEIKSQVDEYGYRISGPGKREELSGEDRKVLSERGTIKLTLIEGPLHTISPSMTDVLERSFVTEKKFSAAFGDGTTHTFTHIQVNGWRDMGLVDLNAVFQACLRIPENVPVAAHCQGGVGRAGTFAAILFAIDYFKENGGELPPIARSFANLRSQRPIIQDFNQLNLVSMAMDYMRKSGLKLSDGPNRELIESIRKMAKEDRHMKYPSTIEGCRFLMRFGALGSEILMKVINKDFIGLDMSEEKAVKVLKHDPRVFEKYNTMMDGLTEYARKELIDLSERGSRVQETLKLLWDLAGKGLSIVDIHEKFFPRNNKVCQSDEELEQNVGLFGLLWSGRFDVVDAKLQKILNDLEQNTASTSAAASSAN